MAKTHGIYRATYTGKDGTKKQAKTWFATWWDPVRGRARKKYGFRTAAEAAEYRSEITLKGPPTSMTVAQLLEIIVADYKLRGLRSTRMLTPRIKMLKEYFGDLRPIDTIDVTTVNDFVGWMKERKRKPGGINRHLATLKRAFRLAQRKFPRIKVPYIQLLDESDNVRLGFLEKDELDRIMGHLPDYARPVVRVLYITGWRKNEVLSRRWKDVQDGMLMLHPGETKNKKPRAYPLEPDLKPILDALPRTNEYIFTWGEGLRLNSIDAAWRRARVLAGLPHRLIHDFRRTAARDLIRSGADRVTAKKLTGHLTDSMFERYQIVDREDLKAATLALSKFRGGKPADSTENAQTRNETG